MDTRCSFSTDPGDGGIQCEIDNPRHEQRGMMENQKKPCHHDHCDVNIIYSFYKLLSKASTTQQLCYGLFFVFFSSDLGVKAGINTALSQKGTWYGELNMSWGAEHEMGSRTQHGGACSGHICRWFELMAKNHGLYK